MAELLWRVLGGGGFVLLGCWIYLRPTIVFGDWHESPKVFTFVRAWALCMIFSGLFFFFGMICLAVPDSGILGLICAFGIFAAAGLGTWYVRKSLQARTTHLYADAVNEHPPSQD